MDDFLEVQFLLYFPEFFRSLFFRVFGGYFFGGVIFFRAFFASRLYFPVRKIFSGFLIGSLNVLRYFFLNFRVVGEYACIIIKNFNYSINNLFIVENYNDKNTTCKIERMFIEVHTDTFSMDRNNTFFFFLNSPAQTYIETNPNHKHSITQIHRRSYYSNCSQVCAFGSVTVH